MLTHLPRRPHLAATSLSLRSQIRNFQFGKWPFATDPVFHRELRRRHKQLKHKCRDALNRKLQWQDHPFAKDSQDALRRVMSPYWLANVGRFGFRWNRRDEFGGRAFSMKSPLYQFHAAYKHTRFTFSSQPRSPQSTTANSKTSSPSQADKPSSVEQAGQQDYVIDPITNRKVPITQYGVIDKDVEAQVPPSTSYTSQFESLYPPNAAEERPPVHSNGKPPTGELNKYAEVQFDDWAGGNAHKAQTFDIASPTTHPDAQYYAFEDLSSRSEEYSLNHLPPEDSIEEPSDLHKYQTGILDTDALAPESQELQDELSQYKPFMHQENSVSEDSLPRPDDLKQYESPNLDANHQLPSDVKHDDLEKYRSHVVEETWTDPQSESSTLPEDLHKYRPAAFEDIVENDQPFHQYGDLESYKSFRLQQQEPSTELDQDTLVKSLQEFDLKEKDHTVPTPDDVFSPGDVFTPGTLPKMDLPEGHVFSKHYSDDAASTTSASKNLGELYREMSWFSAASDAIDREINDSVQKARRNFSEEPSIERQDKYTDNPALGKELQANNLTGNEEGSEGTSSGELHFFLEPALDRHYRPRAKYSTSLDHHGRTTDLYSREPQGLETSFMQECGGKQMMPIYTRSYGTGPGRDESKPESCEDGHTESSPRSYYHRDPEIDGLPRSKAEELSQEQETLRTEQPKIYKILAYDSTMQSVNVAETTSVVPELASPLTPTEVLPRLSHPDKFFPYFAPLREEGFEIVSGSGDMLVFCQMRPAKTVANVNPIDMMGRATALPNAAAFVSPTGFVNYDIPRVDEELDGSSFRSGIERSQEQPVFEESKSSENGKHKRKKMGLGNKVLVGGAWVAGVSYSIGVLSDYFSTGGSDGKGPDGFSPR
ncbi:hypothetical protein F5Y16DRAFT_361479 [Xylariaceae sp. FL0255]|nr:hypothetical protein F5Y16DRAFT_361479 [Xylariaceae sp. FL0255]